MLNYSDKLKNTNSFSEDCPFNTTDPLLKMEVTVQKDAKKS